MKHFNYVYDLFLNIIYIHNLGYISQFQNVNHRIMYFNSIHSNKYHMFTKREY